MKAQVVLASERRTTQVAKLLEAVLTVRVAMTTEEEERADDIVGTRAARKEVRRVDLKVGFAEEHVMLEMWQ